jgi:hypothetical protein
MGNSKTSGGKAGALPSPSSVRAVHELFVAGEVDASYLDSSPLRRVVAESWERSLATGVDPDLGGVQGTSATLTLEQLRATHPLASALPVIRRLLVEDASDAGVVVAVTAVDGTLLWVEGDRAACHKAEAMNFVPGADWSERSAGTNAPGTALALDRELQIVGSEHFTRIVQPWSCTAVPVHDPVTGALLGAIDLTGGAEVATPQTLALVRATAVAVENHLALLRLTNTNTNTNVRQPGIAAVRLSVLGTARPLWVISDGDGQPRAGRLTGRHADILVLLSRHPEGLSADHLAMLLDDHDLDAVTIRVEMSRLRRVIGAEYVASRPYRLLAPVDSDVGEVFDALQRGDVDCAMTRYAGALLPQSVSPAIARLRTELTTSLRAAVLSTGRLALLQRWLDLPEGRDDRDGWQALHDHASADAVGRAQAHGHLAGLDAEFC